MSPIQLDLVVSGFIVVVFLVLLFRWENPAAHIRKSGRYGWLIAISRIAMRFCRCHPECKRWWLWLCSIFISVGMVTAITYLVGVVAGHSFFIVYRDRIDTPFILGVYLVIGIWGNIATYYHLKHPLPDNMNERGPFGHYEEKYHKPRKLKTKIGE